MHQNIDIETFVSLLKLNKKPNRHTESFTLKVAKGLYELKPKKKLFRWLKMSS